MSKVKKALANVSSFATVAGKATPAAFATRGASASTDGSGAPSAVAIAAPASSPRVRLLFAVACAALLAVAALLFSAAPPPALAATLTNERPFLFAFDGSDTTAGPFLRSPSEGEKIAVDNATGAVYVADMGHGVLDKFNSDGQAQSFAATGTSSLPFSSAGVAVDNSGVNPGRIYTTFGQRLRAFDPDGTNLWSRTPTISHGYADVAVDASGHPWATTPSGTVEEYESSGSPAEPTGCTIAAPDELFIDVDASGNVYTRGEKYTKTGPCTFTESSFDPAAYDLYVNQSTTLPTPATAGHIFAARPGNFAEFDPAGTPLGTYGAAYVKVGFRSAGIAYNPSLDRVYVFGEASHEDPTPVVAVFGPPTSGTVPDVTEILAPSSIGASSAHFEGTVNPQNVASKAHFEWKRNSQSWAAADLLQSSSLQALTANETPQTVEFDTNRLRGNRTYEVRLVTVNDANGLRAFSAVKTFTTSTAPAAPDVTIDPVSATGTTTATVEGTVNPKGDTADWRVQLQNGCSGGFSNQPLQTIGEGSEVPVAVDYDPTGLLPSERYCARISATNSFGTNTSSVEEFETDPIPPSEVETAFAAPRTDTTARLNGRANPEGEALTYYFEWSEDGGATWQVLSPETDTSEAREPIVLGQQLSGLSPNTTYSYRLLAENPADAGSPLQGAVRTFSTRTTAEATGPTSCPQNAEARAKQHTEYLPDCRGIELVNNPEKGEKIAVPSETMMTTDGEKIVWSVFGAAPGGYNTAAPTFLARRTGQTASAPTGWESKSIAPPPAEQLSEGEGSDTPVAATPDLSQFILAEFLRPHSGALAEGVLSRLREGHSTEPLAHYPQGGAEATDVSDDGARVITINPESDQLEDVGAGEPGEVLSIMPDGTQSECGISQFGSFSGFGQTRMISTDASRVYFFAERNGACVGFASKALYMRNREANAGQTTLIDPDHADFGDFLRTTPDGRTVYYLSYNRCRRWHEAATPTCEAPEANDQNADPDVYRWDEETGESTCLTCVVPDAKVDNVQVSADLSHVYFSSEAALLPGTLAGHLYIYVLGGGEVRFVADITGSLEDTAWVGLAHARLSADGNVLLFGAVASPRLTSDRIAPSCEGEFGDPCTQLYRYDDRDASLECVSCRRGGETSQVVNRRTAFELSRDGSTIVFAAEEALVRSDVNRARDLYEWREGRIALLSDGVTEFLSAGLEINNTAPEVKAVDANGSDIFFTVVAASATGFEADNLRNAYDARIGGGFPPPTPPAHCTEDSCQGPLQAAPALDQAGSSTYSGPGNVKQRSCRRGKVRRHGRCFKQRSCRRGKVRRHGRCVNKRHHRRDHRRANANGRAGR